jgi:hypothetical protein
VSGSLRLVAVMPLWVRAVLEVAFAFHKLDFVNVCAKWYGRGEGVNADIPILFFVLVVVSFSIVTLLIARAFRAGKLPASCELKARTLTEEQLWLSCPEYKRTITHESGR